MIACQLCFIAQLGAFLFSFVTMLFAWIHVMIRRWSRAEGEDVTEIRECSPSQCSDLPPIDPYYD